MANKIRVYGQAQNRTALGIINAYLKLHPDATLDDLRVAFPDELNPERGVAEIFIAEPFDDKGEHYFTDEEDIINTPRGKVAMVRLWPKQAYDDLVKRAGEFGIEVAEFEQQQHVGKKGNYHLEFLDVEVPERIDAAERAPHMRPVDLDRPPRRGAWRWLWLLLCLIALIVVVFFFLNNCYRTEYTTVMQKDTIKITNTVTQEIDENTGDAKAAPVPASVIAKVESLEKEFDSLEFPVGHTDINARAKKVLDELAGLMAANPGLKLRIDGYASPEGSKAANDRISEERAEHVVDYLESKGVADDRLVAQGHGSENLISDQLPPNRRVEFVVL